MKLLSSTRRIELFGGRVRAYINGRRAAVANGGPVILWQCIGAAEERQVPRFPTDWGPEAA